MDDTSHIDRKRRALIFARIGLASIAVAAAMLLLGGRLSVISPRMRILGGDSVYSYGFAAVLWEALPTACMGLTTCLFMMTGVTRLRVAALLAAAIGLGLAVASYQLATDRVVIGSETMTLPGRGFPLRPHATIRYDRLRAMLLRDVSGNGRPTGSQDLRFIQKDGTELTIPVGDLVRAALKQIIAELEARGVPVAEM
jgi:hypothetical protein